MSLILVEHDTDEPALYGALAAVVTHRVGARFSHLPARFDTARLPDAVQHVTADGVLVGSGLVALERHTDQAVKAATTLEALTAQALSENVVVPLHPALQGSIGAELRARATADHVALRDLIVVSDPEGFHFQDRAQGAIDAELGDWRRDAFGRLVTGTGQASRGERLLRIALIGTERDHCRVYPAALAALGDAADAAGLAVAVTFVAPPDITAAGVPEILNAADGILLPGGADMVNVPGQIAMAHGALQSGKPVLGLCLGMQSMTTAVAQQALGTSVVGMAEADPDARIKSFIAMAGIASLAAHRLGDQTISVDDSSRLAGWTGVDPSVRCNHRFRFNLALAAQVEEAGLRLSAWDRTRQIVDAVEHRTHPFYVGLQGHPELSSRPGDAHPVIRAFIEAIRVRR